LSGRATRRRRGAGALRQDHRGRKRAETADTIQYWKSTGVAGTGGVIKDKELQIWIDWLVKDGLLKAGQVKPTDLYTNAFNPYFTNADKLAAAK
jgi:hypothetical protein